MNGKTRRRAVAYARFSSELQSPRSIDDQVALCRDFAARQGFDLVAAYDDRAKTGASMLERDGLLRLLADAKAGQFDVVVVEALDRISRDQEDMAAVYKRLRFLGIEIIAVHDGKADIVQIGIRSLIGAVYLEDLKHKVRRGMQGRVRDGLSAGGKAYGYKPVLGKPGELAIDDAEAAIVRRVFADFLAGKTPREIAWALNREGVAPPRGRGWTASTLNGSAARENGILRNTLYGGTLTWNRNRMIRDPDTGKRISRINPKAEWQFAEAAHLRIIDAETMAAVTAKLEGRKALTGYRPRRPRMLSGLLRCAVCGSGMAIDGMTQGHPRIRCSAAKEAGTCNHSRKYPVEIIEQAVVDGLRAQLANPAAIAIFVEEYVAERRRLAAEAINNRSRIEADLAKKKGEVNRLIDMAMRGLIDIDQLADRKGPLDADVARLEAARNAAPAISAVELHPAALAAYERDMTLLAARLGEARADPSTRLLAPLRRLVDAVLIHPSAAREPIEIEIKGKLGALLGDDLLPPSAHHHIGFKGGSGGGI